MGTWLVGTSGFVFTGMTVAVLGVLVLGVVRYRRSREPSMTLDDIAGADDAVGQLRSVLEGLGAGQIGPTAVLLHGAVGVGKGLLARAVAGDAGVPVLGVRFEALGDSFRTARGQAPSVLVIKDIDHADSFAGALVGEIDSLVADRAAVLVVATATDLRAVNRGLRSRFGRTIAVQSLDVRARAAVLRSLVAGQPLDIGVDLTALAHSTAGFTRAELEEVVRIAVAAARDRSRSSMIVGDDLYDAVAGVVSRRIASGDDAEAAARTRAAYRAAAQLVVVWSIRPGAVPRSVSISEWRSGLDFNDLTRSLLDELVDASISERVSIAIAPLAGERVALGSQAVLDGADLAMARVAASSVLSGDDAGAAFKRLLEDSFRCALREVRRGQVQLHQIALALVTTETVGPDVLSEVFDLGESPD